MTGTMTGEAYFHPPEEVYEIALRHEAGQEPGHVDIAPSTTGFPEDDPVNELLAAAGVAGRPIAHITAGEQDFVVLDMSETESVEEGGEIWYMPFAQADANGNVSEKSPLSYDSPYALVHLANDGTVTGRAIRPGESNILIGRAAALRDPKSDRFAEAYKDDRSLSRRHFTVGIGQETGNVRITSAELSRPTAVRYSTTEQGQEQSVDQTDTASSYEPSQAGADEQVGFVLSAVGKAYGGESPRAVPGPDYENARHLDPDELWRQRNNGGGPQDPDYIATYRRIRNDIVDVFESGSLYRDTGAFERFILREHKSTDNGQYTRLNGREGGERGFFRVGGRLPNSRLEEARQAEAIARRYGDTYTLARGNSPDSSFHYVELPGIERQDQAYDTAVTVDGRITYRYWYPASDSISAYMRQICNLGQQIESAIKSGDGDPEETLRLIARQYQYGAIARPFRQINNSLFMELANAQTKMLGYGGITHGSMDTTAQRIGTEAFAQYFVDRVLQQVG